MKKMILVFAISTCAVSASMAQKDSSDLREKFTFGLRAGLNYSNVWDTKLDDFQTEGKFGFAGGVFIHIPIGKYFGFQPEALFSQKGYKASGSLLGISYTYTSTTNWLDVPLLIAVKPIKAITILVGPQYSYLLSQKNEVKVSGIGVSKTTSYNNDNIRKNTLCAVGGIDVNVGRGVLALRAGYDLQDNDGDGTSSNPRYKNAWYQATVGFRF